MSADPAALAPAAAVAGRSTGKRGPKGRAGAREEEESSLPLAFIGAAGGCPHGLACRRSCDEAAGPPPMRAVALTVSCMVGAPRGVAACSRSALERGESGVGAAFCAPFAGTNAVSGLVRSAVGAELPSGLAASISGLLLDAAAEVPPPRPETCSTVSTTGSTLRLTSSTTPPTGVSSTMSSTAPTAPETVSSTVSPTPDNVSSTSDFASSTTSPTPSSVSSTASSRRPPRRRPRRRPSHRREGRQADRRRRPYRRRAGRRGDHRRRSRRLPRCRQCLPAAGRPARCPRRRRERRLPPP